MCLKSSEQNNRAMSIAEIQHHGDLTIFTGKKGPHSLVDEELGRKTSNSIGFVHYFALDRSPIDLNQVRNGDADRNDAGEAQGPGLSGAGQLDRTGCPYVQT